VTAEMIGMKKGPASGPPPKAPESLRFRLLISICAAFVAGVGLVALLGWTLGLPVLASLGPSMIPVAPSTAELFVLYAISLFIRSGMPLPRWKYLAGIYINGAGALTALLLLVLSLLGVRLRAEHLGFTILNAPGGTPAGHMSPVTALCFLLSSFSYLLSLSPSRNRWRPANIAWWLAWCIIAAGSTLVLAYLYGTPMLYGSAYIPPAALTSVAFMALGTALLALAAPNAWAFRPNIESSTRTAYTLVLVFVLLAGGIVTSGFLYYRNYEIRHRTEVEHQLSAIADLKADELDHWRKERLGDASLFYENMNFSGLVSRYLQKPDDEETTQRLRIWLQNIRKGYQYDEVFLLDAMGRERMSVPEDRRPISRHTLLSAEEVMRKGQVAFEDFYRNKYDGRIYLAVLVPILDEENNSRSVGTLVLRINPEEYFYPFISRWPTPSSTAETLLVRREGNEAVFLNELRFRKNAALNLRSPLDRKDLPAAQAVLGRLGITEGRDYRGVPVIADVRAVPGSPWFLVSRIDISEVYGPAREKLWMTIVLVMALTIASGGVVGLAWRRQHTEFYRMKFEAAETLRASEKRYRQTIDNMMEGLQIIGFDWRYLYVNDSAARHGRRAREELLDRTIMEAYPGVESTAMFASLRSCMEKQTSHIMENEFIYPDGSRSWFELSIQPVPEGILILSADITERKKKETEIEEKNAELERFIYTISHDLKSPLVTVKTFLGYLREDLAAEDTEKIEKDMGFMRTAAEKMGILLDELLEMSRVGRMVNPPVRVSFAELVDEALHAVAGNIAERRAEVRVSDEEIMLCGDRARLVEIWQNLVENAVKFMGDQSLPRIEIGVERYGPGPVFFVRDNGMGIDPRYREKVFGLFDKLDPKSDGTGLGLALVKRIVEMYRGKIRLESEGSGKGSCFRFTLPGAVDKKDKGEET
jgi:PAS domain S-box-containing protein